MAVDPKNLTVDFRQLMRMTVRDRASFARSAEGPSFLASLTPVQLALLFPGYWKRIIPIPSGTGSVLSGGTLGSGGGGGAAATLTEAQTTALPVPQPQTSEYKPEWLKRFEQDVRAKTKGAVPILPTSTQGVESAGPVSADKKGKIDATQFRQMMIGRLQRSSLNGYVPVDGARYGITKGTPQEWANYFVGLAQHESGLNIKTTGDIGRFRGNSNGLFQLSPDDAKNYGFQSTPFTMDQLADPNFNADIAVRIHEHWLLKKRKGIKDGAGKYWGPISREGWTPGRGRDAGLPWSEWAKRDAAFSGRSRSDVIASATDVYNQDSSKTGQIMPEPRLRQMTDEKASQVVAGMATGQIPLNEAMLANALSVKGLNENRDTKTLMEYFRKGGQNWDPRGKNHWCAVFVNTSLAQVGVKGTNSAVASSFLNWGHEVSSPEGMQPGDVLVLKVRRGTNVPIRPGATGGHVGMATGRTRMNNGVLEVEMYGGNQSDGAGGGATLAWYPARKLAIRRAPEFITDPLAREKGLELSRLGLTPGQALQSVGKPSSLMDQTTTLPPEARGILPPDGFENLPESIKTEIQKLSSADQQHVYGLMEIYKNAGGDPIADITKSFNNVQGLAKEVIAPIVEAAPGEVPKEMMGEASFQVFGQGTATPTVEQRKEIFKKGGVVVNLDTNWAKKGQQTAPMIVIPDNATDEQRQRAQEYADAIEDAYRKKFGESLKAKVVSRSENGRGREGTIHTEPYSVNDDRAVKYFTQDPEGKKTIADITARTLGKIQGAQFSLPHDPYREKPDYGASGQYGNEVDFARGLLSDMQAIRESTAPIETRNITGTVEQTGPTATPLTVTPFSIRPKMDDLNTNGYQFPKGLDPEMISWFNSQSQEKRQELVDKVKNVPGFLQPGAQTMSERYKTKVPEAEKQMARESLAKQRAAYEAQQKKATGPTPSVGVTTEQPPTQDKSMFQKVKDFFGGPGVDNVPKMKTGGDFTLNDPDKFAITDGVKTVKVTQEELAKGIPSRGNTLEITPERRVRDSDYEKMREKTQYAADSQIANKQVENNVPRQPVASMTSSTAPPNARFAEDMKVGDPGMPGSLRRAIFQTAFKRDDESKVSVRPGLNFTRLA